MYHICYKSRTPQLHIMLPPFDLIHLYRWITHACGMALGDAASRPMSDHARLLRQLFHSDRTMPSAKEHSKGTECGCHEKCDSRLEGKTQVRGECKLAELAFCAPETHFLLRVSLKRVCNTY